MILQSQPQCRVFRKHIRAVSRGSDEFREECCSCEVRLRETKVCRELLYIRVSKCSITGYVQYRMLVEAMVKRYGNKGL